MPLRATYSHFVGVCSTWNNSLFHVEQFPPARAPRTERQSHRGVERWKSCGSGYSVGRWSAERGLRPLDSSCASIEPLWGSALHRGVDSRGSGFPPRGRGGGGDAQRVGAVGGRERVNKKGQSSKTTLNRCNISALSLYAPTCPLALSLTSDPSARK